MSAEHPIDSKEANEMRASYARVLVVWLATLASLYAFQEYFR
jgi:hypothetical protein